MEATEFGQRDGISSNETRVLNSRSDRDDERKNRSKSARIIERTTTMLAPVARTKESSEKLRRKLFPPAFPAFQRSNLPIFRGEATSRKIGARPANQQRFMQLRGYEFGKFFRSTFPSFPSFPPFPLRSSSLTQQPRKRPLLVGNFVEN